MGDKSKKTPQKNNSIEQLLLSTSTVFTIDELGLIWEEDRDQILWNKVNYLVKVGKLKRLKRGIYVVAQTQYSRFELANKLKTPSYISFDTVLAAKGVINQYDERVHLASNNSLKTEVAGEKYVYYKLKDEILASPKGLEVEANYTIANIERAYMDSLYLNSDRYFDDESKVDFEKCRQIVDIYQTKSLTKELFEREKNASK